MVGSSILFRQIEEKERPELRQKARIKWAIDGDEKSNRFHTLVNQKWQKRSLKWLLCKGLWITDPDKIKNAMCYILLKDSQSPYHLDQAL